MGPEGVLLRGLGDLQNLPDALDDGLGHNAVLLIIGVLDGAAAFRLVDGRPHGGRDLVGVHDDEAVCVSGRPADGLDQAGLGPEEALLVRVQDRHQADLRQVQPLPQEVDAHQHVELSQPQAADDLHALDGLDIGVHVPYPDAGVFQVLRQVLRHLLGEGGHQYPLVPGGSCTDLVHQVVDLAGDRPDLHLGIQQARGADHLLHHLVRPLPLIGAGRCRDKHRLADPLLELLELQRSVVVRTGQAEAVLHQGVLPGMVAVVHGPDLGQGHVALVHEQQEVVREEVQQGHGGGAGGPVGDDAGVVLDAGAVAQLRHHLHVVLRPLTEPLGLHQLVVVGEVFHLILQLPADLQNGFVHLVLGGDIVAGRVDGHVVQHPVHAAGDRVEVADPVDLVPEELHPDGVVPVVGGVDLHRVPPDPEHVPLKGDVVALVADLHQAAQQLIPVPLGPHPEGHHQVGKIVRLAQAVDAGHGGYYDHVPPLQQGTGGTEPQPVDLVVGGGILGDIGVRMGDIRLWLVVVVVGDEVLHRVVGEELLELRAQLGGQGLVVGQHQRGPLHLLDDLGHGKGLAGSGNAQQHLLLQPVLDALRQRGNGLRLVPGGLIFRYDFKFRHSSSPQFFLAMVSGDQPRPKGPAPRPRRTSVLAQSKPWTGRALPARSIRITGSPQKCRFCGVPRRADIQIRLQISA